MNISVLILTLNEEVNLPGCLESVSWSDDIVVFDSFSTDKTVEIAEQSGTRVVRRKFDNYAAQRNAALTEVKYKNDWLLMVDADEHMGVDIAEIIKKEILSPQNTGVTLFHLRRWDYILGKKLPISTWFGRLIKIGYVTVERDINEEYHTTGRKGYIKSCRFEHYPLNKGFSWWIERHNRYSSMEALRLTQELNSDNKQNVFSIADPILRRKFLKQLFYRLPFRPFWIFIYFYIIRLGFIHGKASFYKIVMRCMYEVMIDLKIKELRRRQKGLLI